MNCFQATGQGFTLPSHGESFLRLSMQQHTFSQINSSCAVPRWQGRCVLVMLSDLSKWSPLAHLALLPVLSLTCTYLHKPWLSSFPPRPPLFLTKETWFFSSDFNTQLLSSLKQSPLQLHLEIAPDKAVLTALSFTGRRLQAPPWWCKLGVTPPSGALLCVNPDRMRIVLTAHSCKA